MVCKKVGGPFDGAHAEGILYEYTAIYKEPERFLYEYTTRYKDSERIQCEFTAIYKHIGDRYFDAKSGLYIKKKIIFEFTVKENLICIIRHTKEWIMYQLIIHGI